MGAFFDGILALIDAQIRLGDRENSQNLKESVQISIEMLEKTAGRFKLEWITRKKAARQLLSKLWMLTGSIWKGI